MLSGKVMRNFSNDFNSSRPSARAYDKRPEKVEQKKVGDWSEQVSKGGKKYFYNCKTEVSQWEKPPEWLEYDAKRGLSEKQRKPVTDDVKSNESSHSASAKPSSSSDFIDEQQRSSHFNNDRSSTNYGCGESSSRRYYRNDKNYHHRSHNERSSTSNAPAPDRSNQNYRDRNNKNRKDYANSYSDRSNQSDHSGGVNEYRQKDRWKRERTSPDRRHHSNVKPAAKRRKYGNGGSPNVDQPDRNKRVDAGNIANNSNEVDLERLPHLLVEIAERHNIDLSDPEVSFLALEKIKQHLKEALTNETPTTLHNSESVNVSDTQPTLQSSDTNIMLETKEENVEMNVEPPLATLSDSHALFYNEILTSHIRNWSSIHFENQAQHLSDRSFQTSLDVAQVSADLKCARSLVRTAEIRSTLLEQRISYLRQQHHQLDTFNSKPTSSSSYT